MRSCGTNQSSSFYLSISFWVGSALATGQAGHWASRPATGKPTFWISELRRHAKRTRLWHTPQTSQANRRAGEQLTYLNLRASCMLSSILSLALAMAPMFSLAPRFPVFRFAASFAPTLATHGGMATGMHGYMECESAEPGPDISCRAGVQYMRQLSSKPYLETTCCGAAPGACPESGLPRSTKGLVGRTPLVRLPSSYVPVSGRGLTSCRMRAGDLEPYDGLELKAGKVLPQLPRRPPGARYLLSRDEYSGTLIVTLPPLGIKAAIYSPIAYIKNNVQRSAYTVYLLLNLFVVSWLLNPRIVSDTAHLVQPLLDAVNAPAIFGCAGASWLAARAFTTATLSVGEFQWEYKETIAGRIPTCYRQGSVEELDVCLEDKQLTLITGLKTICISGNTRLSEEESAWVFNSVCEQIAAINRPLPLQIAGALKSGLFLSVQSTIDNMLSK
jgi:hypothetical protein